MFGFEFEIVFMKLKHTFCAHDKEDNNCDACFFYNCICICFGTYFLKAALAQEVSHVFIWMQMKDLLCCVLS